MASLLFDPLVAFCADWRKIWPDYKRHLDFEKVPPKCPECAGPGTRRCSACHKVAYCSEEHQKSHWKKEHRNQCCPFKIVTDPKRPELGRFVVATRDLLPGDVIIEEPPITAGPTQFTPPVCLGCYKQLECGYNCPKCKWPMCGELCCKAPLHQATGECFILANCSFKPKTFIRDVELPIYEFLTPMRSVLIKKVCPQNWKVIQSMEQHKEERRNEPFFPVNQTNTVKFLLERVLPSKEEDLPLEKGLNPLFCEEVTEDDVNTAIDVLDVNSFEIRGPEFSIRGIYPLTAMMNSVCNPNTQNCIGSDFVCKVRAVVPIKKGEEITSTYTLTLSGTLYRRQQLKESKYFDCMCKRCSSPTELGSHFSTLICQNNKCQKGLITSKNSLDAESDWECDTCGSTLSAAEVNELVKILESEVSSLNVSIQDYENQLRKYSRMLHPNHHINIDLKYTLVQLYGREQAKPLPDERFEMVLRKKELCENVLQVLSIVTPGMFRCRGMFLSELYGTLLFLAKMSFDKKEISKEDYIIKLNDAKMVLEESIKILSYEPPGTIEAAYWQTAMQFKVHLDKLLHNLEKQ